VHAAQYVGRNTITVTPVDVPEPSPGQVQIEVAYTGICGTDLHVLHGSMDARVTTPAVIGHEMSGRIAELGEGVTGWSIGDPVTVMPLEWCGVCPACTAGHHHICHRLNFIGIDSPGALQNRWNVDADVLVAVPPTVALAHAALVEPVAVAVHDVRRSQLAPGEHAVVLGGGPIGLLIATVAAASGARVAVVELDETRRELIAGLGFEVLDPRHEDTPAWVERWTDGKAADVVFEVSGAAAAVLSATDLAAVRGRIVIVAIHPTPREVNLQRVFWRELTLLGARVYERTDFERAVTLLAEGAIPADTLISRIEPLHRTPEAFAALAAGGVMKVLVDCQATS
jgi:(R,R)-butanediol dehydrogenase / meso-butanediol dehydrogenase / diacetyl reductase